MVICFLCSLQNLVGAGSNQHNLLWPSLLLWLKSKLFHSVGVWKMWVFAALCVVSVCVWAVVRVLHAEETERRKCAMVAYHIIKKKKKKTSDSANSVSVRIQITNKCRTLLNRPLAIIAGPTRHFQNLWRFPIYLAINPCHVTNRFVPGNDLLSQGYMKWSWPLSDRQELNWPTCPGPHHLLPSPIAAVSLDKIRNKK